MEEWINLIARWAHLVVGAAWIGASFYFNWLNNHVRPPEGATSDPGVKGELWAVHGGAFYRVQKFGGAPETLPKTLHWFKYEAYFTWVTGMILLVFTYWLNAKAYLIDTSVAALTPGTAVGIGLGAVVGGWLVYDGLCRSPLRKQPAVLAAVLVALFTGAAWGLQQVFAPRAAYIHVGAMLGTIMAANVFFVIIPGQRRMVDAMIAGREPDLEGGAAGALRSLHNNYLTLPVLFVMVSNHYPITWGHPFAWGILAAIALSAVAIRHWQNLTGRGEVAHWLLPAGAVGILATAFVSRPAPPPAPEPGAVAVNAAQVQQVIAARCLSCHASTPFQAGFAEAPKGLVLETPEQIEAARERIHQQVVATKVMPLGNLTGMTDDERALIGRWTTGR